ncbi:hypothetical protein Tco_1097511 [Tanacetum coccineum]
MDSNPNDQWELSFNIDDSYLRLTPVLRLCSNTRLETSTTTQNPNVEKPIRINTRFCESLGDIKNFYKNGKLDQVVAIVKSCTPNVIGDLTVTLKDLSVLGNGSGVGGSGMLDEEEIMKLFEVEGIMKLFEEEEMADLELQVCGNVTDQEDQYKLDEEALNLALEEEARAVRAEHEWLEKCRQEQVLDGEHER